MVEIAYWDAQGIPHTADGTIYLGVITATPQAPGAGAVSVPGQDNSIDTSSVVGTNTPSRAVSAFGFGNLIDQLAGALKVPNWVIMAAAAIGGFYLLEKFGPRRA